MIGSRLGMVKGRVFAWGLGLVLAGPGGAWAKAYGSMAQDLLLRFGPPLPHMAGSILRWVGMAVLLGTVLLVAWRVMNERGVAWGAGAAALAFGAAAMAGGWAVEGVPDRHVERWRPR